MIQLVRICPRCLNQAPAGAMKCPTCDFTLNWTTTPEVPPAMVDVYRLKDDPQAKAIAQNDALLQYHQLELKELEKIRSSVGTLVTLVLLAAGLVVFVTFFLR